MIARTAALCYVERGWSPIPIPFGAKRPTLTDWPNLRLNGDTVPTYFGAAAANVGVILGDASGGLADVDIDCVEGVDLADRFCPATDAVFGRPTKPRSHRLYVAPGAVTIKFVDPLDKAMLVELRANGGQQTVFPGSVHPSGEAIEWDLMGRLPSSCRRC